ncbi:MAG: acyl carrier protein [Candidatus Krumholzibacteriota bacterium]|nr:acyl carrier protein [Candidatus Krumholzibacteriota bacterium]
MGKEKTVQGAGMEIKKEIHSYIEENVLFNSDDNSISDDDSFMEKGIIDSTGILELVSFIEGKFDFKVDDEDLVPDNFDSVNNLASYIEKKIVN